MEWTGFTDEQLRRLKQGSEQDSQTSSQLHRQQGRTQVRRAQLGRERTPSSGQNRSHESEPAPLDQSQMLSRSKQVQRQQRTNQRQDLMKADDPGGSLPNQESGYPERPDESHEVKTVSLAHNEIPHKKAEGTAPKEDHSAGGVKDKITDNGNLPLGKELDEKEGLSRELTKLEEFQQRQKEIEGENQRKKNLLRMAIADRKKKTQAEVKRLAFIQKELSKIEEFLTADVNILRDKIEDTSRQYSDAQKRYQKAESEFVAAKIHLHKVSDQKEALTEHLCTIIRENELRKAKKLEELTEKLDADNLAAFEAQLEATEATKKTGKRTGEPVSPTAETVPNRSEEPNISGAKSNLENLMQGSSSKTNEPDRGNPLPCSTTTSSGDNGTVPLPNSTSEETQKSLDSAEKDCPISLATTP